MARSQPLGDRVMRAVSTLNYRANHNARNLRTQQSRTICLLHANPSRNYIGEVHLGALQRCQTEGYSLITEDWSAGSGGVLALRSQSRLAGAILTPPLSDDPDLIGELRQHYTIIIVTHSMAQAERVSQKTCYFHLGYLVEEGPTETIFNDPEEERTRQYISGVFG